MAPPPSPPQQQNIQRMGDAKMSGLFDQYRANIDKLQGEQGRSADQTRANIETLRQQPQKLDLSPLLAYAGSVSGTDLMKGYQRPQTPEERAKLLSGLEGQLAKQRGAMTQSEISQMQGELGKRLYDKQLGLMAQKQDKAQAIPDLTKGQEAVDRAFAKTYEDYIASGGKASIDKNLGSLKEVRSLLGKSDSITGGFTGATPKWLRDYAFPKSAAAQDTVEGVIQQTLRATLGAQFTEKEASRLIERSYNPRLSEAENSKRLDRTIKELEEMASAKESSARYFEEHGSLTGYKGTTARDILDKNIGPEKKADPASQRARLQELEAKEAARHGR